MKTNPGNWCAELDLFGNSFDVLGAYGIILGLRRIGFRMLVEAWRRQPVSIRVQPCLARSNLGTRLARVGLGSAQLGSFWPRVSLFGLADGFENYDTQPHSHVAEFIVQSIVFEPWL